MNTATTIIGLVIFLASCEGIASNSHSNAGGVPVNSGVATLAPRGPLKILTSNPRYFTDGSGRAVYLTGSHHWDNLQDYSGRPKFDYGAYLNLLRSYGHNLVRLWVREGVFASEPKGLWGEIHPVPYRRTGPGAALDGKPKFDLTKFDPAYFERLRSRVLAAQEQGIYVMVMLFQGFGVHNKGRGRRNPWPGHPFNAHNNINGIDGDASGNGEGEEVHTLRVPAVTKMQEAYVRRLLDTLNDLNNVLYEISNESHRQSVEWQYHMIGIIHEHERSKPKQHPVVMSSLHDGYGDTNRDNTPLFVSPAEAVAPGEGPNRQYKDDPPPADGSKVIISDTDHLWGVGGDEDWVWKSFLRGLNPIFMDPIQDPKWDSARKAMGQTLTVAQRINLASMLPRPELASTGYCLTNPGKEYLVYLPSNSHWFESRLKSWMESIRLIWRFAQFSENLRPLLKLSVEIDLSHTSDLLQATWFKPSTGEFISAGQIAGKGKTPFTAPFSGHAVLHLTSVSRKQKAVSS